MLLKRYVDKRPALLMNTIVSPVLSWGQRSEHLEPRTLVWENPTSYPGRWLKIKVALGTGLEKKPQTRVSDVTEVKL
jgi:hypothetical protein